MGMSIFTERGAGEGRGPPLYCGLVLLNTISESSEECCTLNTALTTTVFLPSVGSQVGRRN